MANVVKLLKLTNTRSVPITIYLEPWGDVAKMGPAVTFTIQAEGPEDGDLEITVGDDQITIRAWAGSTMTVYEGTKVVFDGCIPVPAIPPGTTARSFLHRLFGWDR